MPFNGINWKVEFPNMLELGKAGKSLNEIGEHYGVTRERIRQVYKAHGVDPRDVGVSLRVRQSREERARQYFNKWGDKTQLLYDVKRTKFRAKKANASRIGVPFTLTFAELVWPTHCPVLGIELDYEAGQRQDNSVSFDRLDGTKGYVSGNVILISYRANRIRNNGSVEEHEKIVNFYRNVVTTQ